jgi:hypothetical protein
MRADALHQFLSFQMVRRPRQHVHLHAATIGPHQPLDDHRVPVALVLHPERMLGFINELADAMAAVSGAPDQVRQGDSLLVPTTLSMMTFSGHGPARLAAVSMSIASKMMKSWPR